MSELKGKGEFFWNEKKGGVLGGQDSVLLNPPSDGLLMAGSLRIHLPLVQDEKRKARMKLF